MGLEKKIAGDNCIEKCEKPIGNFMEGLKSFYNTKVLSLMVWALPIANYIFLGYPLIGDDNKKDYL